MKEVIIHVYQILMSQILEICGRIPGLMPAHVIQASLRHFSSKEVDEHIRSLLSSYFKGSKQKDSTSVVEILEIPFPVFRAIQNFLKRSGQSYTSAWNFAIESFLSLEVIVQTQYLKAELERSQSRFKVKHQDARVF